ncbi:MAG: hypothetical protein PHQ55_03785 [Eubacteriales bacterium]|nr:hypothetical protein [Eubacteriales bacterium]
MCPMGKKTYRDSISRTIYNLIRLQGDTTRQFLADTTQLPPTSMNRVLDKLIKAGLIAESGLADSTGGRRANLYSQRTDNYCFGIMQNSDTQTILRIYDPALQLLDECQLPLIPASAQETPEIAAWFQSFTEKTQQMMRRVEAENLRMVSAALISDATYEDSYDVHIRDFLQNYMSDDRFDFRVISTADAASYGSLWSPASRKLGEATIVLLADMESVSICLASDGLRHDSRLKSLRADDLIVPLIRENKPLTLAGAASASGLLEYFNQIKQNSNQTWQDFTKAAAAGKKKATHTITIAAAGCASAIVNAALLSDSDHWIITGQLTEELPGLEEETAKQLDNLLKKSNVKLTHLKTHCSFEVLIWQGAGAYMLENFLGQVD